MAEHYVIIGNGIAGVTAAEVLRNEDPAAEISMITDNQFPPYYRPALKDFLAGRISADKLWSRPLDFNQEQNIRLITGRAVAIQVGQHLVQLQDGQQVGYSRLLIACGARASQLKCPGIDLAGVTTLRDIADYQEVQKRLPLTRRVVVSGSGTLALETIETLRHRGYAVTHLLRKRTLWSEVLDPIASDLIIQQERRGGVEIRFEEEIAAITGKAGQVNGVVTTGGARIACEQVIVAIGIDPEKDFVQKSGIPCGRGVIVDQAMRTGAPDVYAAGDALEITDKLTGRKRVLGQWYPAIQQARAAAYSMLGCLDASQSALGGIFYNATSLFGLDLAAAGLTQPVSNSQGYQELVADPEPRVYRKVLLKNGVIVGMITLGNRRGAMALKRAIDHGVNLQPVASRLFARDFELDAWLEQQGVPATRLNISRAGATTIHQIGATIMRERETTPVQPSEAWLIASAGPTTGSAANTRILLSQAGTVTVGRQEGVYLLIDHASVSRRHAEIRYQNGEYCLHDVGSANGTFVNDRQLPPMQTHILQPGDQIRFGKIAYQFQMSELAGEKIARQSALQERNTRFYELKTGFYDPAASANIPAASYQPVLNDSGELLLPGANRPIPASVVATFRSAPALIAVRQGVPVVFLLKRGKHFTLGRDKSCDLVLEDIAVSRKHAEIIPGVDGFSIRDVVSSNGVSVNQARIDNPYRLKHGDRIGIGGATIYFFQQDPTGLDWSVASAEAICSTCGASQNAEARFCARCGAPWKQPAAVSAQEEGKYHAG